MLFETTILVPPREVQECQTFLNKSFPFAKPHTFRTYTGKFPNGIEVDIKVCEGNPPFVDPVLYDDDSELAVGEVRDDLLGVFRFQVEDDEYKVTVQQQE